MKNCIKFIFLFVLFAAGAFAQSKSSEIASMPGAFSRLGFGARGMGMGNAASAVIEGNIVGYYNPALSVFQNDNSVQAAYSVLSLDRSLNFLSFTKRFDFRQKNDGYLAESQSDEAAKHSAGISAFIINSSVRNIDGRDIDGVHTEDLTTSENLFYMAVSNRFSNKLALGLGIRFYYYKLYKDITANGIGLDLGAIYRITKNLTASLVISDLNSKYRWDSTPLYGTSGTTSDEKFPVMKKLGVSYKLDSLGLLLSGEIESSNAKTNILRFGAEYRLIDGLYIRGGMDKWNLNNSDNPVRPSAGFSYSRKLNGFTASVDYAFVAEPYSTHDAHVVGLSINF
jgi:hypothetical protein